MQQSPMLLQVGVKVFLRNSAGKYLILKRSAERYPNIKNLWDIVGGRINPGTPLMENLKREIEEETGLELKGQPSLIAAQDILRSDKHIVRLTYLGEAEGVPRLSEEETDFSWESVEELRSREDLDEFSKEVINQGLVR